jgi:hypothetical protein
MSWIKEEKVDLPPVIASMSINRPAMDAVQNLATAVTFGGSTLSRVQEEAISTVVAAANSCRY